MRRWGRILPRPRVRTRTPRPHKTAALACRWFSATSAHASSVFPQAQPLGPYYAAILAKQPSPPLQNPQSLSSPSSSASQLTPTIARNAQTGPTLAPSDDIFPSPPSSPLAAAPITAEERAAIIFGTRLAGPERERAPAALGTLVAGVLVPPRPEEPDNCCMSGCVNCVWERYRDEMDEWAAANAEAKRKLAEQEEEREAGDNGLVGDKGEETEETRREKEERGRRKRMVAAAAREEAARMGADALYADVPVGIREFMMFEKRLREKQERERGHHQQA